MADYKGEFMLGNRRYCYQRVWETPADTLRKEFGISNVGLGKICRHRQIPVPPRGYWAKKYAGHKTKPPPPLPKPTKPEYAVPIHFHKEPVAKSEVVAEPVAVPQEIAFERDLANAITVPADLRITQARPSTSACVNRRHRPFTSPRRRRKQMPRSTHG